MNLFEYPMYPRVPPRCPQVQVLVDSVVGCLPVYRDAQHLALPTVRPSALWVEAVLADRYDTLGIPVRTSYAEATFSGCTWDTTLTFATRYRDLDHTAQLALTVWEVREGVPQRALAGATLRFFSKKGRLKTGAHTLRLWTPGPADGGWPSKTPGKVPLKERGERGRVEQVLKRFERGELESDPELGRDNPSELKARKLARSHTRGLRRALTRFLRCVDWADGGEAAQAAALMAAWAPIDVADALELLSPDYGNEEVRGHAVRVLEAKGDEELLAYMLQLVQALRYEPADDSRLGRFLARRGAASLRLATPLFWYLCAELEDPGFGRRAALVQAALLRGLDPALEDALASQLDLAARLRHLADVVQATRGSAARRAETLRALVSPGGAAADLARLACPNPLDPGTRLLGLDASQCTVFKSALCPLRLVFFTEPGGDDGARAGVGGSGGGAGVEGGGGGPEGGGGGPEGGGGVDGRAPAGEPGSGLASPPHGRLPPNPSLPLDPFPPSDGGPPTHRPHHPATLTLIYKRGDDLRQDQLVVQMISLMDTLLRREHLDLRVTRYAVLPTSSRDGLIQFVPAVPLARLLATHRSIHRYLAQAAPDATGPYGLQPGVLANFVKSCAAACVMTYILGVGDRHLDNLLLARDGRLFHIDFGFILGRDPKPFPPPMKLCREMVDALGGADSEHYRRFASHACEAFNVLRKSAGLLTGLLRLMAGSRLPDIAADPDAALLKVQEKLRLDLGDEEAARYMRQLLADSASALMPAIMETTHRWAQYWR
ncbi:Phosphatidylinositol 3-kinase, root isoform [Auxenochlorella protothecoides]|uniref:phosphatidylinositol 3-kinase n=1 Tax=Auxenochlorella protothecoides TaxID=3075 RepID=A0A087SK99_AUXPR|nr:Phosphatidylinositol 3-kinase, root isoform [Auxenochlorella protothecoides]KFM26153.1 Phosphatidylinositol 3-kinase, root isoform [Auxenochlorella protothecoides]